jgi:hypothetical protein
MKRLLTVPIVLSLVLGLTSPVLAGHRGIYRGHRPGVAVGVRGAFHHFPAPPIFRPPRIRSSFSLNIGFPVYAYDSYYYAPAPVYYRPPCEPVWIPGHYVWDEGVRFYVTGHWSR